MFDARIRPVIDPLLNRTARYLARVGIGANALTAIGFFFSLCAFAALSFQNYALAVIFIILSRLMDGLDGPLARQTQSTDFGGFLDIVCDFIFYAGIVFFFAVGRPDVALPAAFLIFSFIASGTTFLAYAIIAAKRGINHDRQGKKSFFYMSGLMEGAESIVALILMCIIPNHFLWIAIVFGGLCWVTALGRVIQAKQDFWDAKG